MPIEIYRAHLWSMTKALQRENITCYQVRVLFDSIIEEFPSTAQRLSPTSEIVLNPTFERAVVKIQSGSYSELTIEEAKTVECLKRFRAQDDLEHDESEISFAEREF